MIKTLKKVIEKLKNRHFLSLFANGSMAVLSMVTIGILFRYLPATEIGYWFFFQTVFVLLDTFRTGFLQVGLIKFFSGTDKERGEAVLGSVWFLGLAITAIMIAANLLFYVGAHLLNFTNNEGIMNTIHWFGITFLCTLPSAISSWILQASQRFDRLLILRILNQGFFILMILLTIALNKLSSEILFMINAGSALVVSSYCIFTGWTNIRTFPKRSKEIIKDLFNFGKYSVGTSISTNLLRSSDTFIIMFLLGTAGPVAIAMYAIPMRLMEIIEIPLRSFLATGMPSMSAAFNKGNKKEVTEIMQKYAGTISLGLVPVSLIIILLADVAVEMLGGSKYAGTDATSAYRILMAFAMVLPIDRFLGITLDIIHKPKINFYKVLVMLATNIVFDFIALSVFKSINGVALATFFTLISGTLFGYYWLRKYLDFTLLSFYTVGFSQINSFAKQYLKKSKKA